MNSLTQSSDTNIANIVVVLYVYVVHEKYHLTLTPTPHKM